MRAILESMDPRIVTQIMAKAHALAGNLKGRRPYLERQKAEIQKKLASIQADLDATNLAVDRLATFNPTIAVWGQCPSCWLHKGIHSNLTESASFGSHDVFRCDTC